MITSQTIDAGAPGDALTRPAQNALENIELVIFDCDGVLIDSEPIASRTLAECLTEAGIEISTAQAHARFTGHSEIDIRALCERDLGLTDAASVFAAWHRRLYAEFARSLTAMPGMVEVVEGLTRPKCVASNSTMQRLSNSLGYLDLWHSFAPHVFSAEAVARPKPAPDLLLHCADRLSVAPSRCVMIDDSPHGVAAALAAGMIAVGFVDPADRRPSRKQLLADTGAFAVATGAAELPAALLAAGAALAG